MCLRLLYYLSKRNLIFYKKIIIINVVGCNTVGSVLPSGNNFLYLYTTTVETNLRKTFEERVNSTTRVCNKRIKRNLKIAQTVCFILRLKSKKCILGYHFVLNTLNIRNND